MIVQNPRLQITLFILSVFGSLATLGNFAYTTCDRIDCWKYIKLPQERLNPCPPILSPGKDCNDSYSQKNI